MKTTLLITTYNWPQALDITLRSVENQSVKPSEIIIADDGSGEETRNLVKEWQAKSQIPIIHSWQEDDGFRAASSRNKAIAANILLEAIENVIFLFESKTFAYDSLSSTRGPMVN